MSDCLEAALKYAKLGWRVIPLHYTREDGRCSCLRDCGKNNHSKHPLISEWTTMASTDEAVVREWFSAYPHANIGIATGVNSGIFGIDIDVKKEKGDEEFAKLEQGYGQIPETLIARTPTGGYHIYFHCTKPFRSGTNIRPGIDIRAEGGQLVAPPSITPKGQYTWAVESPISDPPQWIENLLEEHKRAIVEIPNIITEGGRNDLLTRLAGSMRRKGFSSNAIEAALQAENITRCNPPLSSRDVKIISHSVSKYEPEDPVLINLSTEVDISSWSPPKPLTTTNLPSFPLDTLPIWIRNFCEGMAEETQTPVDLAAMFALTMCSLACAKKYQIHIQHGWYQPLNLYNIVVMRSGSGKSPVFKEALRPIGDFEQKLAWEKRAEIEQQNSLIEIRKMRKDKLLKDHAKAGNDIERNALWKEIDALTVELAMMDRVCKPQLVLEDTTAEALASAIFHNNGRMGVLSDEGDGVLENMAGRYSKNGSPNFEIYLKAHSGEPFRVNRIGRADEYIQNPSLTVGLAVQPHVLSGMWLRPGFSGKGLLARFWYCIPNDFLGERDHRKGFCNAKHKNVYYENILHLLKSEWDEELIPTTLENYSKTLELSKEAHEIWLKFCEFIEPQLKPLGRLGELSDWGGKFAGVTARIAALIHLTRFVHEVEFAFQEPVCLDTMERAISIAKYALEHSLAAFKEMRTDTSSADAKKLINGIKKHGWEEFTRSDAMVKLGFRGDVLDGAISLLLDYQYIREADRGEIRRRGRPAKKFIINPYLFKEEKKYD